MAAASSVAHDACSVQKGCFSKRSRILGFFFGHLCAVSNRQFVWRFTLDTFCAASLDANAFVNCVVHTSDAASVHLCRSQGDFNWRDRLGDALYVSFVVFELLRQGVFTLVTTSDFLTSKATFLDDVKEWCGLFFDTHQLGIMLNFHVDVKILLSTSKFRR